MSKYNTKKIEYNGMIFDSRKEMKRYKELEIEEKQGLITNLKCQVKYVLIPCQRDQDIITKTGKVKPGKVLERECSYIADFEYIDSNGNKIVEDVKGYRYGQAYALYTIKRKLMLLNYGISVKEI